MQGKTTAGKPEASGSVRASISFPPELYHTLEEIAKQKKVSVAWVIRDAAERYISDQWPLLNQL
jgi:metal-responsive CopG/Arc/MetJ family transcriptional regulator